jgi:hypothetical protein
MNAKKSFKCHTAVVPQSTDIFIYNTVNKYSRLPVSAYSQPTFRPTHYVELTKNLHNSPYINLAKRSHTIPFYTNVKKLVQNFFKNEETLYIKTSIL